MSNKNKTKSKRSVKPISPEPLQTEINNLQPKVVINNYARLKDYLEIQDFILKYPSSKKHLILKNDHNNEFIEIAAGVVQKVTDKTKNIKLPAIYFKDCADNCRANDLLHEFQAHSDRESKVFVFHNISKDNIDLLHEIHDEILSDALPLVVIGLKEDVKDSDLPKNFLSFFRVFDLSKPLKDQVDDKTINSQLYKKTPENAKWQDLTMAFPNHFEDKVEIFFKGKEKDTVTLKDLDFVDKKATKTFKPLKSLVLLKRFAEARSNHIPSPDNDNGKKKLHTQVVSLRNVLKQCFGVNGDPVPAADEGGYRLQFKAYCYDKKGGKLLLNNLCSYFRKLKNETNKTKSVHDEDKIRELKDLIYNASEKIIETNKSVRLENTICTECYDKLSFSILTSDNMIVLCKNCAESELSNEYESSHFDNDIPRSE